MDLALGVEMLGLGVAMSSTGVRLSNAGDGPLVVSELTVDGDFTARPERSLPIVLPPDGFCAIDVRFVPHSAGVHAGKLSHATNAGDSRHRVALNATGTTP